MTLAVKVALNLNTAKQNNHGRIGVVLADVLGAIGVAKNTCEVTLLGFDSLPGFSYHHIQLVLLLLKFTIKSLVCNNIYAAFNLEKS